MYVVEGELTVQENPENYIGCYGMVHETDDLVSQWRGRLYSTSEENANAMAAEWRAAGRIPEDMPVEHIESLEQAEKYAWPEDCAVSAEFRRQPDEAKIMAKIIPDDIQLIGGKLRVWRERRIPTPRLYFRGLGKLLAEVEYDPAIGWVDTHDKIEGQRTVKGFSIFGFSSLTADTEVEAFDYRRRQEARA